MSIVIPDDSDDDTASDGGTSGGAPAGLFASPDNGSPSTGLGSPNYEFPAWVSPGPDEASDAAWGLDASDGVGAGSVAEAGGGAIDDGDVSPVELASPDDAAWDVSGDADLALSSETGASPEGEGTGAPDGNSGAAAPSPSPRKPKETHQIGDSDIDRLLQGIYPEIRRSGMANMGPLDLWSYMQGTNLDTNLMRPPNNPNAYYQYHGTKYPLLDGKTFTARDLNYLGVGAGFGARQLTNWEMNLVINKYKESRYEGDHPSENALAAAETGRRAYGQDQAWRLTPDD